MAESPFIVKRKTGLGPVIIRIEQGFTEEDGTEATRTIEFKGRPFITGTQMLGIASLVDNEGSAGSQALFDLMFEHDADEAKRWKEFLDSDDGPDANELVNLVYGLIAKYGNRSSENPTD